MIYGIGYAFGWMIRMVIVMALCYAAFSAFAYVTVVAAVILGGMK